MSSQKKLKKRNSKSLKNEKPLRVEKKTKPLTFQKIAFVNITDPPPLAPITEKTVLSNEIFSRIPPSLIEQFLLFIESYSTYYTNDNFIETFGITSKTTLNKWTKFKGLPYYQIDSITVFKRSDVDAFLERFRKIMP
jgi:hypothetical protein